MKSKLIIIIFVFFSYLGITTNIAQSPLEYGFLKEQISNTQNDTSTIRLLNTLAYKFYWDYEYDSCHKYAFMALSITDSIRDLDIVNKQPNYLKKCKQLKAISLANMARGLKKNNTQAALDTLHAALELIRETGNKLEEAKIYESIGVIYDFNGEDQLSLKTHRLSLDAYKEARAKKEIAFQLVNVAVSYRNMGNYGDALEYLVESLKISKTINDSTSMVEAFLAMGFTYMYVEKWEEALKVQQEALAIYEKMDDSLGIARIHNDMGVTNMNAGNLDVALEHHKAALAIRLNSTDYYYTYASHSYIGEIYEELSNYSEAIRIYEAGKKYAKLSGMNISVIYSYLNSGSAYLNSGDLLKALEEFQIAIELSAEIEESSSKALASLNIARIYLKSKQPKEALIWLQKAEVAAPKSNFTFLENIYQNIAESYFQIGDHKNAYQNLMIYCEVKDSLSATENLEKLTTLVNRLEFENKKKLQDESHNKMIQIKQAEIERQKVVRNFSLFGAFAILILAIIYFARFVEKKKLNTKLNATLQNLESTQSQLIHSEKMASLGELTAGIAHEIQNPLNFVKNFSEVNVDLIEELKEEIENGNMDEVKAISEDIASNEEKITHHSIRAGSIIKGMLLHSRTGNLEKEPVDINKTAEEYLRLSYHGLRAKDKSFNADFKMEGDESIPKINIYPQEIGRVLLNLINNAFHTATERAKTENGEFMPMVVIKTAKENNHVIISVKDNGLGIPDNILDKIFQPFFTTKSAGEGTGLGLSLSYDIITKGHAGKLDVKTEEGKGTEFIITMPINAG